MPKKGEKLSRVSMKVRDMNLGIFLYPKHLQMLHDIVGGRGYSEWIRRLEPVTDYQPLVENNPSYKTRKTLSLRMNIDEVWRLKNMARADGVSLSKWIRDQITTAHQKLS